MLAARCEALALGLPLSLLCWAQAFPLDTWSGLWFSIVGISFLVTSQSHSISMNDAKFTSFDKLPFSVARVLYFCVCVWLSFESLRTYSGYYLTIC